MPFAAFIHKSLPTRDCAWCGSPLAMRIARDIERKKYCSHSCRQKMRVHEHGPPTGSPRGPRATPRACKPGVCRACGVSYLRRSMRQKVCWGCAPDERSRERWKRYGLTQAQFDAAVAAQGGRCALCPKEPTCVDHCHATGTVRGILCESCNMLLGLLERRPDFWEKSREYLAIL
jgi:hypothetical protein